jgi:hypothetical protein
VDRVVILKVDGLPGDFVERLAGGDLKRLPSIRQIFAENGAWLENFYVRGLSLSAPSWSMLDTGRHLEIRGNVEFDRYTLRPYDYLNFFPFYLGYARSKRVDMTGVELLDELGIPLLIDRFPYPARYQGPQLLQRGVRWTSLPNTLKRAFTDRSPKRVFDEWQTGLSWSESWSSQTEKELIEHLANPEVRYLDYFVTSYDHVGHLTPDPVSQFRAIQALDALAGRIWTAIGASPYPETTVLILVSDHGMNTAEGVYSQGYNLVDWFASAAGGGHHVLTNRHPLTEFKLRGLDPMVSQVVSASPESLYLDKQSESYPTVMLDLDGNERASAGLRNNTFNKLHVLLDQLVRKRLPGPLRTAALNAFFAILNAARPRWERDLEELSEELYALDLHIQEERKKIDALPKKWSAEQRAAGLDKDARRRASRLEARRAVRRAYGEYVACLRRLLALDPADFDPGKFKIETLIPSRSLGPLNGFADLQHYVTGPAEEGLVLGSGGGLDLTRSFREIDYFVELTSLRVRNNVQREVGPRPVDFVVARVPREQLRAAMPGEAAEYDGLWLWRSAQRQALLLSRRRADGAHELRYLPVAGLHQDADGAVKFEHPDWSAGFPLELYEDAALTIPSGARRDWLSQWHTEREWLEATHRARYSNAVVGLAEELLDLDPPAANSPEERLRARERRLRRTDLLIVANDHWNFNVRGFNPGGNHGSFFRVSTHSVLLFAGGKDTGIPRGARIPAPYDSLSFVPTVLALMDRTEPGLPGPVIKEVLAPAPSPPLQ